jgi:hypothetical protein
MCARRLTTKLSHPGPVNANRDSGTEAANPGWLERLVSLLNSHAVLSLDNFRREKSSTALDDTRSVQ